jgi:hypothetical protein
MNATETTVLGDIVFINQERPYIIFNEISDPSTLTRLLKSAKEVFIMQDKKFYFAENKQRWWQYNNMSSMWEYKFK